jgi:hypothetical protein
MQSEICFLRLLSENLKIKNFKHITFSLVVLCVYETSYPTLREERKLRALENRVLRRIFGARNKSEAGGNYITRISISCSLHVYC